MVAQPAEAIDPRALLVLVQQAADRAEAVHIAHTAESDWEAWLRCVFPGYVARGFAPYHVEFWRWVWLISPGERMRPFVGIWPRGWGKSTSAELALAALAARQTRRYVLYVCETQEQADDHVANVAGMLESGAFGLAYPKAAQRKIGKYGNVRGWRRNRLRTASGFTVDAIGLDTAARGVKIDEDRPDLLLFDDLDGKLDSPGATEKKITTLTHTLLPAGADDGAVLMLQNLILADGVFARLADGRADFLADRIVSGPHPALTGLAIEARDGRAVIVAGEPTWPAMGVAECQAKLDDVGRTAFLAEEQHDVSAPAGGMFDHVTYKHCAFDEVPDLVRTTCWVDPAVTDTDQSDANGIQIDGIDAAGDIYRLFSWEQRSTPDATLRTALTHAKSYGCDTVGVETNQGGDLWRRTYREIAAEMLAAGEIDRIPTFREEKAGSGSGPKTERAGRMLVDYERARITHALGTHETLERALKRFPKTKPYDLVDACLVAGTLVETADGHRPIETIKSGDLVRTRSGFRRVLAAGQTGRRMPVVRVAFATGNVLIGTPNHPVYTYEAGWIPLGESVGFSGMIRPCPIPSIRSRWNIGAASTDAIRTESSKRIASITSRLDRALVRFQRCIGRFGSTITGRFRTAMTSITATAIRSTTTPIIWPASMWATIDGRISTPPMATPKRDARISRTFADWPLRGIAAKRGARGIANTPAGHWASDRSGRAFAECAERRSPPNRLPTRRIAPGNAVIERSSAIRATSSTLPARSAATSLPHQSTGLTDFAPPRVETVISAGYADVYNLTVDDVPEYFANGVLVHNCYWSWRDLRKRPSGRLMY